MTDDTSAGRIEIEIDLPPGQVPDRDTLSKKQINSPSRMGVEIPTGWKPTLREPVPVVRCHYIFKDSHAKAGERCDRWSLRGSLLCFRHSGSGNLKYVEEYRQAVLEAARLKLLGGAPEAVDVILDLMINSGADNVKLKAAMEVLDRTGVSGTQHLNVNLEVTAGSPAETLSDRLQKLKVAAEQVQNLRTQASQPDLPGQLEIEAPDPGVIEGEIG